MAAPPGVAKLAPCVVVVAALGANPIVLLDDLGRAIAVFTAPPEAEIVVPTCPADPVSLAPWMKEWTPLLAGPIGAVELPLCNQLLAHRTCPCPLLGHIGAVGPCPRHHAVC